MANCVNNWILALGLVVLICVGCKQSNSKTDFKPVEQMAVAELKTTADKGNPRAQFELGERFQARKNQIWWQGLSEVGRQTK